MKFELPPLPYAKSSLEPHLSARTLEMHYERHHRGYLEKLKGLIEGTPEAESDLLDLVLGSTGAVYNNAAQVWNHSFYWDGMTPDGGGEPTGALGDALVERFGSVEAFREEFVSRAVGLFGSGYVWLVFDPAAGRLEIDALKDADHPLLSDRVPILNMDVWEHAYYLDHQNRREVYARAFLDHLVNWRFANENFEKVNA